MAKTQSIRSAAKASSRRAAAEKSRTRSYGLNDPESLVVEDWPESKRALYESARTLFWERGFAETSVQEIVEGARLTKGAFYHYFDAKEDLLRVMYDRSLVRLLAIVREKITPELPSRDAIAIFMEAFIQTVTDYRVEAAMFWEQYRRLLDELFPDNLERRREFQHVIVGIVERGVERGELVNVQSPAVTAMALTAMCQFTHHWYQPGGKMTPEDIGRHYADLVLNGIAAR